MNTLVRHLRLLFSVVFALGIIAPTAKADTALYTDGPTNGTYSGLDAGGMTQVEDSFTLSSTSTLTTVLFGTWVNPGDTPRSVEWAIVGYEGSQTPVCGDCSGTASLTGTFDFNNSYDEFDIYDATFSLPDLTLSAGTYWLELQKEETFHGSRSYWDVSGGPSMVWSSFYGDLSGANCASKSGLSTCSNAFTIYGVTGASPTPEPSSLALLGSAALLLGAEIRRRHSTTSNEFA